MFSEKFPKYPKKIRKNFCNFFKIVKNFQKLNTAVSMEFGRFNSFL